MYWYLKNIDCKELYKLLLDKGGGAAILHKFLIFGISDENKFFVTKAVSPSRWSCIYISTVKLSFPYIGISQFDIWWMSKFFLSVSSCHFYVYLCNVSTIILKFIYIDISHFISIWYMSEEYFFCYLVAAVVRFLHIDKSTVTLKRYIDISHWCVKKNFFVDESVSPLPLSILLYQLSLSGLYILILFNNIGCKELYELL